jgi:NAD(P)-dependent dehydrogenase (short-subunit alcohol dehydrogenase family)
VWETDLSGRRALVTGGASGIGAACARRLAETGARVTIADLDGGRAESVAAELHGDAWQVDLADTAALADVTLDVDVLVNNAGFQHVATVCPAYVRTPLVEGQIIDQAKAHGIPEDEVLEQVMLTEPAIKRLVEPTEVADVVAFLCSSAASFITGSAVTIDGGWSAR